MADIMELALDCASPENPVLFLGPPGVGKTARIEQWAERTGKRLIVEHPVIAQSVDYRGLPAVVEGEAHWLPLGNLKQICAEDCPPTVLLFDDVGQASASVQAALMQLVWARKLGDMAISDNVTILLASNRVTDRSGVRPMLTALIGRCQVVHVGIDIAAWGSWAIKQHDIDPSVVGYARFRPDCFVSSVPEDPMVPFCTPRSLARMGSLVARNVRALDMLAGWVGMPIAADYAAYAESVDKLPAIGDLLDNPKKALAITDPGLLHAVTAQAARHAEDRGEDVIRLASTLGSGWNILMVSGAADVFPGIKKSAAFNAWAINHRNII